MYIAVVDTGSSSMRCTLLSPAGAALFTASRQYHMETDGSGRCEMDPAIFRDSLYGVCRDTARYASDSGVAVGALALTSQRSSVLPLGPDGQPLGNIVMWHDKRSAPLCDAALALHGPEIYGICGTHMTPVMSAPKMMWLKRERPELYGRAEKLVGIHDYLVLLLTGRAVTDTSLASRTCLLDIRARTWSPRLLELFGLDPAKLCPLAEPGDTVGSVTAECAARTGLPRGIPVVSAGGDQQCSILGQGLTEPGQVGITTGTASYLSAVTDAPAFDPAMRVNCNAAVTPGRWVLEASTMSSGIVYRWFCETFYPDRDPEAPYRRIDSDILATEPGAGGVLMLPSLAGRGCPDWDQDARGVFHNLTTGTTRAHMARAMLEGIGDEIAACYGVLREVLDRPVESAGICGGLSKFDVFAQMVADMTGAEILRRACSETTVRGAWICTACAMGLYESHGAAVAALSGEAERRFLPDEARGAVYRRVGAARSALYRSIPFRALNDLLDPAP